MKLLVLRHAKTDENIVAGWSGQPLLPEGVAHAQKILHTFLNKYPELKIKQIISSDLPRCAQTADIMAKELDVPLMLNPGFRGFNIGDDAGSTMDEFWQAHINHSLKGLAPHESLEGGETPSDFYRRVTQAFLDLTTNVDTSGDAILVTHRSVLEVLYTLVNQIPWSNALHYYKMEYLILDLTKDSKK